MNSIWKLKYIILRLKVRDCVCGKGSDAWSNDYELQLVFIMKEKFAGPEISKKCIKLKEISNKMRCWKINKEERRGDQTEDIWI